VTPPVSIVSIATDVVSLVGVVSVPVAEVSSVRTEVVELVTLVSAVVSVVSLTTIVVSSGVADVSCVAISVSMAEVPSGEFGEVDEELGLTASAVRVEESTEVETGVPTVSMSVLVEISEASETSVLVEQGGHSHSQSGVTVTVSV